MRDSVISNAFAVCEEDSAYHLSEDVVSNI